MNRKRKPFAAILLIVTELFISLGGFYGGAMLIADPSGKSMMMDAFLTGNFWFADYLVPGIILLVVNGLLPLLSALGLLLQPGWRWAQALNVIRNMHWSWTFSVYQGLGLVIWISMQLLIVQAYFILQPVYSLLGVVVVTLCLVPSVYRYYQKPE